MRVVKLINLFTKLFKSRDKPQNLASTSYYLTPSFTSSGKRVTERSSLQSTAVYACVRVLAEAVAGLPLHLYKYSGDGQEKAPEKKLYRLLHDAPNPETTSFVFRETLMTHLLLWGNAYAQIVWNKSGEIEALYPLRPEKVSVERNDKGELIYTYYFDADERGKALNGKTIEFERYQILHIPGLGFDGLVGYSPIALARNAIGMSLATEEYGSTFFANGANPGGVLEHPGLIKDPNRIRESWQSTFGGAGNAHKIAVLEEGMKYHPITINPQDAQFLETRKFQINEIARIFKVPPHMIGDLEKSSFSNIEQQSLEFVKYTLDPWVVRWEQSLNKSLLANRKQGKYFVKFNVDGLLRGDYINRMRGYSVGVQNGFMSPNDVRRLEGMNLIPAEQGGDSYLVNGNMVKLEDAGAFSKKGGESNAAK
jgi:HK97 family phage portal protein